MGLVPVDEEKMKNVNEYKVKIRVVHPNEIQDAIKSPYVHPALIDKPQNGNCAAGYMPGDEMEVVGPLLTKGRICIWAYPILHPFIMNARFGLKTPFERGDKVQVCCSDWETNVVFEISRGEKLPRREILRQAREALKNANEEYQKTTIEEKIWEEKQVKARKTSERLFKTWEEQIEQRDKEGGEVGEHEPSSMEGRARIRVYDQKGFCAAGHKVGDEAEYTGLFINRGNVCLYALNNLCSVLQRIRWPPLTKEGISRYVDEEIPGNKVALVSCPNWKNPVYFEVFYKSKIPREEALRICKAECEKMKPK